MFFEEFEAMNVHSYCVSYVNGPGRRFVLWTQGCSKGCKNCFNPETWNFEKNNILDVEEIFNIIESSDVDGVTITGGDPLEQWEEVSRLLFLLKEKDFKKGVILFSGYTFDEINNLGMSDLFFLVDVLIDGKFEESKRISRGLRGSENQNIIYFSSKIKEEELNFDQAVEVGIFNDKVYVTGFPSISRKFLKELGVNIK